MATYTDNYALVKPTYGELADVAVINGNMDTIDGIMHSNRTMLAPAFSQAEDYAVGDVVVYEGNLYRFIVPHTAGNWDGTEVEQTTLGEEVSTKGGADVTKTASGNPIEITDSASAPLVKCVTQITGSQDLHGYDKPWVGGSGKNKLPMTVSGIKSTNTSGTWSGNAYTISGVTLTILTDDGGNITGIKANGTATSNITFRLTFASASYMTDGMTYKISGSIGGSYSTWCIWVESHGVHKNEMSLDGDGTFTYTSGQPQRANLSIDSGVTVTNQMFYPMIRLSTESDATFAPYSNICPITAYTEGEIVERGKNILKPYSYTTTTSGVTLTYSDDGTVSATGTATANITRPFSSWAVSNNVVFTLKAGTYTLSLNTHKSGVTVSINKAEGGGAVATTSADGTFTTSEDFECFWRLNIDSGTVLNDTFMVQLEKSSTATDYEPYTSTTHTTTFSSAIYRGSEDVVNGEVTEENLIFDLSNVTTWYPFTVEGHTCVRANIPTLKTNYANIICTHLYGTTSDSYTNGTFRNRSWNAYNFEIELDGVTNDTEMKAWLASQVSNGNPVLLAYELATPTTSSVTPTNLPIKSLSGYTHIESSTGDMEVEYITEEFQPIVDLIEDSKAESGHTYSTEEQVVGKWIDGSDVYEYVKAINTTIPASGSATDVALSEIPSTANILKIQAINVNIGWGDGGGVQSVPCWAMQTNSYPNVSIAQFSPWSFYATHLIIQYIESTPTRSLNLTKSAVTEEKDEIPEEIKNAEYEEKPDVNEADDDAPTEVDER